LRFFRERGIEAGIKMQVGASQKSLGVTMARPLAVSERNRLGGYQWCRRNSYGMRWKVECTISAVKRIFGESVRSRRPDIMYKEARAEFAHYNALLDEWK
jgi:hypothetical protein